MELSQKIKDLRNANGFSQQELANRAELSLRTIQHVESGETEPHGDTLIKISRASGLKPEDLLLKPLNKDKYFLPVLNLSALSFIFFPFLGFVVPLILWVLKKDNSFDADSKKLLNFQITWSIILIIIYGLLISQKMFRFWKLGGPESMMITLLSMYLVNFALIVLNTFLSVYNKKLFYQPAIPFLR
ncbi:helix-turn-helix domain-containing protein [Pedobacter aquatilis]|uniref:helix-turn-helix domain-containing protein n=1 Tax=Pedobacter aquatilis TaxID=351343 RepID=UPI00292F5008|nr:helix-turn-helix domain-containing protein [Pedobacter aquatilis]